MKKSSYHNKVQKLIKENLLDKYEIVFEKHANNYDAKTKMYKGKKVAIKILRLYFKSTSFFIREPYIKEYIEFINKKEGS